ncbi:hypothetical protein Vretimale_19146 [Volvox reticuliferus]|nr:hypothetical protein Vretimale_19146 [Volvox reticuliferus]
MVLQIPSSSMFCYCGMKRRRLAIPCADCGFEDSNSHSPAAPLIPNNFPIITPSSGRVCSLRRSTAHSAGPAAAGAAVGLTQKTSRKVLGPWHYPDCGTCPAAFTLLHGEDLGRRPKPERCTRQAECATGKVSGALALQPLTNSSLFDEMTITPKRPFSAPPDINDVPPTLSRVAADLQTSLASPQFVTLRPIPASEQFTRPQAPWSFPAANMWCNDLENYDWLKTGCSIAATITSNTPSAATTTITSTTPSAAATTTITSTTPLAAATTTITGSVTVTSGYTSIPVALSASISPLRRSKHAAAKYSRSRQLASSMAVPAAGGSDAAAAATVASASASVGVGVEPGGSPDWAAAMAAPAAQMWFGLPSSGCGCDDGEDDGHAMYRTTCTSTTATSRTPATPAAAAVQPPPAPSVGAAAASLPPTLPQRAANGRDVPSAGLGGSRSSEGQGSRLLLRLWPLGKQPQPHAGLHVPSQELQQPQPQAQPQPHLMMVTGAIRNHNPKFGAGVLIEPHLVAALPLARLERLLQAAEAAAAAATACTWSLNHEAIAGATDEAATVIEGALEMCACSGCSLQGVSGSGGGGSSHVAAAPLPALRVDPLEYFEVDGRLLKGAVLQTACNVIRLAQLSNSLAIVPPWAPVAPDQDLRSTAGVVPSFGALYGKVCGSGSGGGISYFLPAAQPGRRREIVPLVAVLKVLVAFAGASRALQKVQGQCTEAAAVADGLTALLPLMRRGCACADVLMEKVER